MPHQHVVITLLCDDKPGVVQQFADTISEAGGNWLESRMSQLAGKFAGILKVRIEDTQLDNLTHALECLSQSGIQVLLDKANPAINMGLYKTLAFELMGADRTGIVSEVAHAFTEQEISIDELETCCSSMPWSGAPLFKATGKLLAPEHLNIDDLLNRLHDIENKLGVDISISEQFHS